MSETVKVKEQLTSYTRLNIKRLEIAATETKSAYADLMNFQPAQAGFVPVVAVSNRPIFVNLIIVLRRNACNEVNACRLSYGNFDIQHIDDSHSADSAHLGGEFSWRT